MPRILLDTNIPHGLRRLLAGHDVATAHHMGWSRLTNGDLLAAGEAEGFDLFLTADRNIRYQQNLTGRRIAIVELSTSHSETVRDAVQTIRVVVQQSTPGSYQSIDLPRPPRVRNPPPC